MTVRKVRYEVSWCGTVGFGAVRPAWLLYFAAVPRDLTPRLATGPRNEPLRKDVEQLLTPVVVRHYLPARLLAVSAQVPLSCLGPR